MSYNHGVTGDGCTWMFRAEPLDKGRCRLTGRLGSVPVTQVMEVCELPNLSLNSPVFTEREMRKWLAEQAC